MRSHIRTEPCAALGGEIAALIPPNGIDIRRIVTRLALTMKPLSMTFALLGGLISLRGEVIAAKWNVEILGPITDGTPSAPIPKPEPIDFKVVSSRTTRMDLTEAPEMSDLPPITGTINVTVQKVEDPGLPDPPPPLPALPPDDPAVVARLAELSEKYRGTELVFLSATVYDHNRTLLRIYPNGRVGDSITAWSNLDFHHFSGFSTYRVKDAVDGTLHDFGLLMGIGGIDTRRWKEIAEARGIECKGPEIPEIPEMTDLADGGPSFVVVEGDAKSPAMDTLEQIHDLYRKEGTRMEEAYHAREKARAERKAFLLAHPPKPQDVKIQVWKRNSPVGSSPQNEEGGSAR
jgi:hypothetical protein